MILVQKYLFLRLKNEWQATNDLYFIYIIHYQISSMFFVYFLRSIKNSQKTYVGFTTNLEQRFNTHNSGGSVYTQDNRPWNLEASFSFNTETKALRFERYLKTNAGKIFLKRYVIDGINE